MSGRFDGRKIVYTAGLKARERARDKNSASIARYNQLEVLRRKMAECQTNFLASPDDNPEIEDGKKEIWDELNKKFRALLQEGRVGGGKKVEESKESIEKRTNIMSHAAERAAKYHIHDAIVFAEGLTQPNG